MNFSEPFRAHWVCSQFFRALFPAYHFTISPEQYGTYWWHAHASTQYIDGIYGPLVIHSPNEPMYGSYDREALVVMSGPYLRATYNIQFIDELSTTDWYHEMSAGLLVQFLSSAGYEGSNYNGTKSGAEPPPDSGFINSMMTGSAFNFEPNLRYHLRLMNFMAALTEFVFSVDNHVLSVVGADGTSLEPVNVHRVPIFIAQRYSVVLRITSARRCKNHAISSRTQT